MVRGRKIKLAAAVLAAAVLLGGCAASTTRTVVIGESGGSTSISVAGITELGSDKNYIGLNAGGEPIYMERSKDGASFYADGSSEAIATITGRVKSAKVVDEGDSLLVRTKKDGEGTVYLVDLEEREQEKIGSFAEEDIAVEADWVDLCASYILLQDGSYSVVSYYDETASEQSLESLAEPYLVGMVNQMNVALLDAYFCSNGRYVVQFQKDGKTMLAIVDPRENATYEYIVTECDSDKTAAAGNLVYYKKGDDTLMAVDMERNETWALAEHVEQFAVEDDLVVYTVAQGNSQRVYARRATETDGAVVDVRKNVTQLYLTETNLRVKYAELDENGRQRTGYAVFRLQLG